MMDIKHENVTLPDWVLRVTNRRPRRDWFIKWISSSKFQIAIIVLGFLALLVIRYQLKPDVAAGEAVKLAIAYFAARVAEPVVEYALAKLGKPKGGAE